MDFFSVPFFSVLHVDLASLLLRYPCLSQALHRNKTKDSLTLKAEKFLIQNLLKGLSISWISCLRGWPAITPKTSTIVEVEQGLMAHWRIKSCYFAFQNNS